MDPPEDKNYSLSSISADDLHEIEVINDHERHGLFLGPLAV
jgi:hypothetical protein